MSKVDKVDALPCDHVENEGEVDDGHNGMSERLVVVVLHIADCDGIELRPASATCGIDGPKDWPSDGTTHQTADDSYLEKSQEEVCIEGVMVEDICIGYVVELADPAEIALRKLWRALILTK